jgi:hypothetical protein
MLFSNTYFTQHFKRESLLHCTSKQRLRCRSMQIERYGSVMALHDNFELKQTSVFWRVCALLSASVQIMLRDKVGPVTPVSGLRQQQRFDYFDEESSIRMPARWAALTKACLAFAGGIHPSRASRLMRMARLYSRPSCCGH